MDNWNDRVSNLEHIAKLPTKLASTLIDRVSVLEKELGVAISSLPKNLDDRISNLETLLEEKLKKQ